MGKRETKAASKLPSPVRETRAASSSKLRSDVVPAVKTTRKATSGRMTAQTVSRRIDSALIELQKGQRELKAGQVRIEKLREKSESTMAEVKTLLKSL